MPFPQKNLPIIFILQGGVGFLGPVPAPIIFGNPGIIRPQQITITRPARGTITHTASQSFLDDFGPGVPQLMINGHTGWNNPEIAAGVVALKSLETMFIEYLSRRRRTAAAGADPNTVNLLYLDTLNLEGFKIYPHEFTLDRHKSQPLLYFYRMRFSVLFDLIYDTIFFPEAAVDFLDLGNVTNLIPGFQGVSNVFDGLF